MKKCNGQTIIIIPILFMVIIIAMGGVIDVGNMLVAKNKLQAASDAVSLIGAKSIWGGASYVTQKVNDFAQRNGLTPANVTVTTPYNGNANQIRISVRQTYNYVFLRLLGKNTELIQASSIASGTATGYKGMNSIAMGSGTYTSGQTYAIKDDSGGNSGAISLSGPGANEFRDDFKFGYQGTPLSIGTVVETKPGKMSGPTSEAFSYRYNRGFAGETWNNYTFGNPRVVMVAFTDPAPQSLNGRKNTTVVGFGLFFLTSEDDGGINAKYIGPPQDNVLGDAQEAAVDVNLIE
ncbi:MAG: pilus assembly protein TadG-related protein [Candidatus Margulisiibacteriota bacterium]|jgi:Flp pilus assembly protein TadG